MNLLNSEEDASNDNCPAKRHCSDPKQSPRSSKNSLVLPMYSKLSLCKRWPRQSITRLNYFDTLPEEITLLIFKKLDKHSLVSCSQVCKQWRRISYDECLWKYLNLPNRSMYPVALENLIRRNFKVLSLAHSSVYGYEKLNSLFEEMPLLKLQYLDLTAMFITVDILNALLSHCSNLVKLSLESCRVDETTCYHIGRNTKLIVLNLASASSLNRHGLKHILSLENLQELNLAWAIDDDCVCYFTNGIMKSLKKLNISGFKNLYDLELKSLILCCPELIELDISDCHAVTSADLNFIFRNLQNLEILSICRCFNIDIKDILFTENMPKLEMKHITRGLKFLNMFGVGSCSEVFRDMCAFHFGFLVNNFFHSAIARPKIGKNESTIWEIPKVGRDTVDGSFLESLPKMEEHPERFERSPIDGDIVSSAATIPTRDDAESSPRSDSGLSSVDHLPFISKSESSMFEPSDNAATQMDFSFDYFVKEKIIENNEDVEVSINNIDNSIEPTVIKHPQLLKTTPHTVPKKSNRQISVSKYLSLNQVFIPVNVSYVKKIRVVNQNDKTINAKAVRRLQSTTSKRRIFMWNNGIKESKFMLILKQNKMISDNTSDESNAMYPHIRLTNKETKLMKKENINLPLHYPLTKHQELVLKRICRKIRKNILAQGSRKRKKEYVNGLKDRFKQCSEENNQLKKTVNALRTENKRLKVALKSLQNTIAPGDTAHPTTFLSAMPLALIAGPNLRPSVSDEKDVIDGQESNLDVTGRSQNLYSESGLPLNSASLKDVLITNTSSSDEQGDTIMAELGELLNFNGLICNENHDYTRSVKEDYYLPESDDGLSKATKCLLRLS